MRIFILEDDQERVELFKEVLKNDELTIVDTAESAIELLNMLSFDLILLDHDLGGLQMVGTNNTNTGSEVVRWMVMNQGDFPTIIVHSHNPPAAESMQNQLRDNGYTCHRIPFSKLIFNLREPGFLS